jgi:hypothetical protein
MWCHNPGDHLVYPGNINSIFLQNVGIHCQMESQRVGVWIILKYVFERYDGLVWTGLIWLRIGTSGGLL